jgi:SAM-dependent methyltransferase
MTVHLDISLTEDQKSAMASIPSTSWFAGVAYQNAVSPTHPNPSFAQNNDLKQHMVEDWVKRSVKGKRVLDLFSANGAFTFMAALAGAKQVVGLEYSEERVRCAKFIASTLATDCKIEFRQGDVYKLADYFSEPFDVVLCLGGLYHVADPGFILRQIRRLTTECLILQTSQVLPSWGNRAQFIVRRQDKTMQGLTSIRGNEGTWHCSRACLRELLWHGGFAITQERRPPWHKRRRFPWYLAFCKPY